jgi:diguanylate cyclase (GGDEF)-like protein/PAS domain S-box-containing protein
MNSGAGAVQRDANGAIDGGFVMSPTEFEICRVLAEQGDDIIAKTDPAGLVTYVSPSVERVTGFRPDELIGRPIAELMGRDVAASLADAVKAIIANPSDHGRSTEYRTRRRDGQSIWLESRLIPITDPSTGAHAGMVDVVRDITQRKTAEERLERALVLLETLVESSPSGIMLVDEHEDIISCNQRFAQILNLPSADLQGGDYRQVLRRAAATFENTTVMPGLLDVATRDEIETADGRWIDCYTVPVRTPGSANPGRAWFVSDVTDRRAALLDAVRASRYDHLTGLANRVALFEALRLAIASARRQEQGFGLFCLDLDNFKDVNDTLGHLVGDQLLISVADRLRAMVSDADLVARPGGDEFAIVVADLRTATDAALLADRFIREISAPHLIDGRLIHASVSVGIDLFGPDASDERTLLSHADMALYQAKIVGAGAYRFFTEAMDAEVRTRVTLASELRVAIDADQLFLLFQPQVDLSSGRIVGAEALVRWRHPRRGVIGPDVFIPVAEQMGLISSLGRWVLWAAARQARAWADAGLAGMRMGVNVSALQFRTPAALEADIAAILAETRLPPDLLELELTESALMTASEGGDILMRLHRSGVRIAIDDFGTGYSSLDYLRRFPAGRIKIAQTFVSHLGSRGGDAAIVKATIGLARELGMTTIAEGVETRSQFDMLKSWGCAEGQGYFFDRPLDVAEAADRLRRGVYGV